MATQIITAETAAARLEPHQFNFFDSIFKPAGAVLFFTESITRAEPLQIVDLIPEGTEPLCCIVIQGDLRVAGSISNYVHHNGSRQHGMNLILLGTLEAKNFISTNATVFVHENMIVDEAVYLFYDNGKSELRVDRTLRAKGLIVNDEHRTRIEDLEVDHDIDLYASEFSEVEGIVRAEYLGDQDDKINHKAFIAALESGASVFTS